jgi:hypothetical protein
MSKYCTDASQGRTFTEHGCGGGMAQDVCTINGRLNPGPTQRRAYDMGNGSSCYRVKRSKYGSEHLGCMQRWPALIHVKQNRVANLLR